MTRPGNHFQSFLRRLHRRRVALHFAEYAAAGLAGGCAIAIAALILAPIFERRTPAFFSAWLCAGATAAGLLLALARPPRTLQTALLIDSELELGELFSTAFAAQRQQARTPWASAVSAMADAQARQSQPKSVRLRRVGGRGWIAVGLMVLLLVIMQTMRMQPPISPVTLADASRPGASRFSSPTSDPSSPAAEMPKPFISRSSRGDEPQERSRDLTAEVSDQVSPNRRPSEGAKSDSERAAGDTGSGGMGRSETAAPLQPPTPPDVREPTTLATTESALANGPAAGGRGARANRTASGDAGGEIRGDAVLAAPWTADGWPAAQKQAAEALRTARIPPPTRVLVRQYFEIRQ